MKIYRRQRNLYIFAGLLAVVAIINALFFLILYRPTRAEYFDFRDSTAHLRAESLMRQRQLELKEKTGQQLDTSSKDREELVSKHFIPRMVGYAQILPELDSLVQRTGVRKTRVDFNDQLSVASTPQYGLYSVKIRYPVQGSYSSVVNFIKELERSQTFYIITSVDVRSGGDNTFQAAGGGNVVLSLNLETYLY
jgi:hypothetical protein